MTLHNTTTTTTQAQRMSVRSPTFCGVDGMRFVGGGVGGPMPTVGAATTATASVPSLKDIASSPLFGAAIDEPHDDIDTLLLLNCDRANERCGIDQAGALGGFDLTLGANEHVISGNTIGAFKK